MTSPMTSTTPPIRTVRKVKGGAYGSPYLAPMNPDAHSTTKIAGAAKTAASVSFGDGPGIDGAV